MKKRLLAFLLCLILVVSSFLFTGCGKKEKEVTDPEERETAIAGFIKGVEALRNGGVVATGSVKGFSTEKDGTRNDVDISLTLNFNNGKFQAVATGTADGNAGTFELFFDNEVFASLSTEDGKTEADVDFIDEDLAKSSFGSRLKDEDGDFSTLIDQILALVDVDKLAAKINAASAELVVIKKTKSGYKITVSSDAIFDVVLATLNTLKNSGDKTVAELIDELAGAGTFEKLKTELEKHSGTDLVSSMIPDLEALLADAGLNVNAAYELAGRTFLGLTGDNVADQMRAMVNSLIGSMTVNDVIAMAFDTLYESMADFFGGDSVEYAQAEQYQSAAPGVGASEGEGEGEGEDAAEQKPEMTYEAFIEMLLGLAGQKVNQVGAFLAAMDSDEAPAQFDVAVELAPAIADVTAVKDAVKFDLTVTCDKKLNPTELNLNFSFDGSKLPEDAKEDVNVTLSVTAQVKSSVTVAPSAELLAKIDDAKAKKNAVPAGE